MIKVMPVEVEYVNQTWPMVEGFIQAAFDQGELGESLYSIDNVRGYLTSGQWLLVVAVDENNQIQGAGTVSFLNYPKHRVGFMTSIGGKMITNKDTFAQLQLILKQRGCTMIQAYGRESIVRLWRRYNFKPANTLVEVLL